MAHGSSGSPMGARFPVKLPDESEPQHTPDLMEREFGVARDDPARHRIIMALADLTMRYRLDVHEHPDLVAKAIEKGRSDHAYEASLTPFEPPRSSAHRWAHIPRGPQDAQVYYLRVGKLVKIGTSITLDDRLRSYPPDAVLLATEPGSYDVEKQRHRQFRDDLAARAEWFHPSPALIEHINTLREQPLTAADLAA